MIVCEDKNAACTLAVLHKCTVKDINKAESRKQFIQPWKLVGAFCGWNPWSKNKRTVKLYSLILHFQLMQMHARYAVMQIDE